VMTAANWRIDLPLWLGGIFVILFIILIHLLFKVLRGILSLPNLFGNLSKAYRQRSAKQLTQKGLMALVEEDFAHAEHALAKGAHHSPFPWLNYMFAAKAAHALGEKEKSETYLQQAKTLIPNGNFVMSLMKANLFYSEKEYEQSLALLLELNSQAPYHPLVLRRLQEVYVALKAWDPLLQILTKLKHYHVLPMQEWQALERQVWREILLQDKNTSLDQIQTIWEKIPKSLQRTGEIALIYAEGLQAQGKAIEAEKVLRKALEQSWQEDLIHYYGLITHPQPEKSLSTAEQWLNHHPESAALLLTLGRLCVALMLWGKAQRYFEASLTLSPLPETYAALGALLEKMNQPELSARYFKTGLLLATPSQATSSLPLLAPKQIK
ncbi:MAG: heme biosynthesis HemY N-terminal domain-containing protein, partial [Candidatus Berkiellales bacterium]